MLVLLLLRLFLVLASKTLNISGQLDTLEFLQDIVEPGLDECDILMGACRSGQIYLVEMLIKEGRLPVGSKAFPSAFKQACRRGHLDIAKLLYSSTMLPDNLVKSESDYPLRKAAKYGHLETVKWLLKVGADPCSRDNYAVRKAASKGHLEIVQRLSTCFKIDLEARNHEAALNAAFHGHIDVLQFLLDRTRPTPVYFGERALSIAIINGHVEVVRILLDRDLVDPSYDDNYAALLAASRGQAQCLHLLLSDSRVSEAGIDCVVLNYAAYNGHRQTVALILKMIPGCSPGRNESKAVRLAARKNHSSVVKLLLEDDRVKATPKFNKVIRKAQTNMWIETAGLLLTDPRASEHWWISKTESTKRKVSKGMKSLGSPRTATKLSIVSPIYGQMDAQCIDLSDGLDSS